MLDNSDSKLLLNSIELRSLETSADGIGLDVDADSTVSFFNVGHETPVSIAEGSTLSGAILMSAGSIKLDEAGTLGSSVSMSRVTILDADESMTISGSVNDLGNFNDDVNILRNAVSYLEKHEKKC